MLQTTLCYLERDGCYLMLHRISKKNDMNHDKWIGVGGKFEWGESPEECLMREVKEETGLTLNTWRFRGLITFVLDTLETEYMFLYTSDDFSGEMKECDEGKLEWVKKEEVENLEIWEGDKTMFRLLEEQSDFFSLKLQYEKDVLVKTETKIYPAR